MNRMKIAMMQPTFLPWQGYFELISSVDKFILLDDFQFSRQTYHQRNRLFTGTDQVSWYTVPIQIRKSFVRPLNEVLINENSNWRKKMQKRIKQTYGKTPYYQNISPHVEKWFSGSYESLADYNAAFIVAVSKLLDFDTVFLFSSSLTIQDAPRSERVLEILRQTDADMYHATHGAFEYMKADGIFPVQDIDVYFQNYIPSPYAQIHSESFIPYLSILDALFNIGVEATVDLVKTGTAKWLSWDEMDLSESERPM